MTDLMAMVASSENKTFVKQKMEKVLDLETNIVKVFFVVIVVFVVVFIVVTAILISMQS